MSPTNAMSRKKSRRSEQRRGVVASYIAARGRPRRPFFRVFLWVAAARRFPAPAGRARNRLGQPGPPSMCAAPSLCAGSPACVAARLRTRYVRPRRLRLSLPRRVRASTSRQFCPPIYGLVASSLYASRRRGAHHLRSDSAWPRRRGSRRRHPTSRAERGVGTATPPMLQRTSRQLTGRRAAVVASGWTAAPPARRRRDAAATSTVPPVLLVGHAHVRRRIPIIVR